MLSLVHGVRLQERPWINIGKLCSVYKLLDMDDCLIAELVYEIFHLEPGSNLNLDPLISIAEWFQLPTLWRDLALLENQVPFPVLQKLFDAICLYAPVSLTLTRYSAHFFRQALGLDFQATEHKKDMKRSKGSL